MVSTTPIQRQFSSGPMDAAVEELIAAYQDLNGTAIEVLRRRPSPLEFHRSVSKNRPFVVRGAVAHWPALGKWSVQHLKAELGQSTVIAAVTPSGNADAVATKRGREGGRLFFVKPWERTEGFSDLVDYISEQEHGGREGQNVKYCQTQNDNLRGEYLDLYHDVERHIDFAQIALGKTPEAVNLWIGNSRSVTALHKDNYENIYCQVVGSKHFLLIPPIEYPCVNEQLLPSAIYAPKEFETSIPHTAANAGTTQLEIVPEDGANIPDALVPCALWDPDAAADVEDRSNRFSRLSKPITVTIHPGDMLYLPALWFHKVSQSCGPEGVCIAVNYWYDMEMAGSLWATTAFLRQITATALEDEADKPGGRPGESDGD